MKILILFLNKDFMFNYFYFFDPYPIKKTTIGITGTNQTGKKANVFPDSPRV